MNGLTFSPILGWAGSSAVAVAVVAVTVGLAVRSRRLPYSDATTTDHARRIMIAVVLAIIMMTPSTVHVTRTQAVNATDVFIAVDVTGSMAVSDAHYGSKDAIMRLDAAKKAVSDITKIYPDASFAAIRFGASGTLDVPLTPDSRAIGNWAGTLKPEPTGSSSGSNLDKAIDPLLPAMKATRAQHPDDRIIVVYISDGEQTSRKVRRTFSSLRAYANGGLVVGVGSSAGGRIPQVDNTGKVDSKRFITDPTTKQPGISMMDEKNLKAIADEMSGGYVHADAGRVIGEQDAREASSQYRLASTYKQREHSVPVVWPFAIVLTVLLAWEAIAWARTSRRLI
ncbi:VWA domain-containing protein [Bifidobacterium sp. 82T24]|uniref:vWA domain-containing protein n=1 Tax=Bifidobacterium pluvialisilvae TaxID=2834436 RepID=UPI001C567DB3|nr:VWA domain-containing protein [Bifidobacterium pluvialisilvae]MBW3087149.1 VWA domain-containing protein [Bifidobacterium pluvialisilvae]